MTSQERVGRLLTEKEMKEIEKYNRIVEYHNLVIMGMHPRTKLSSAQIARHGNILPALIEPVKIQTSAATVTQQPLPLFSQLTLNPAARPALALQPPTNAQAINFPSTQRSLPPKENISHLHPSQRKPETSTPLATNTAPTITRRYREKCKAKGIDYRQDYYRALGVRFDVSKTALYNAFRLLESVTPLQQRVYEVLSNSYLRRIYDEARGIVSSKLCGDGSLGDKKGDVAKGDMTKGDITERNKAKDATTKPDKTKVNKPKPPAKSSKQLKIDFNKNYYNILGVQPGPTTATKSIEKAFASRAALFDPSLNVLRPPSSRAAPSSSRSDAERKKQQHKEKQQRRAKWATIKEAHAVLSDGELRKEYDRGRGRGSAGRGVGGGGRCGGEKDKNDRKHNLRWRLRRGR